MSATTEAKIAEGKAEILFPDGKVFYNNVQQFNRDMSVSAITTWKDIYASLPKKSTSSSSASSTTTKPIRILEALSATGLRSIRYAKEIPGPIHIIANDFDSVAVEQIKNNVKHNNVEDLITPSCGDANLVMYQATSTKTKFDVVDLDPYGSASPFIDAAVQCVAEGGLLCVTCTDMAVLAGGQYDAAWGKYGTMPIPNAPYCHEMALRTLLNCISASAGRYKRHIVPLACCSIDFYVRVFVQVFTSPLETKKSSSQVGMVYHCPGCKSFYTQPLGKSTESKKGNPKITINSGPPVNEKCENCDSRFHIGGPMWLGPLHNKEFVSKWLEHIKNSNTDKYGTHARMLGMVTVISEVGNEYKIIYFLQRVQLFLKELDVPLFYDISTLCSVIHVVVPPFIKISSALYSQKIPFSISHTSPYSVKIDGPPTLIWDILRSWAKLNPPNKDRIAKDAKAAAVLSKAVQVEADFQEIKESEPQSRKIKLVRFQENPEKDWGPKARATGGGRKRVGDKAEGESKKEKLDDKEDE
ncbi:tRNA methyltransferase 1 [Nowakowskiella sp. JEL0407]|nr:tRNA methyltransferase 1 [Nowakowskiella sp. JEL0407]